MTTPLSPTAQAVLDAFMNAPVDMGSYEMTRRRQLARAVAALADQVAPSDAMEPRNNIPMAMENDRHRREMLAIAAELESTP